MLYLLNFFSLSFYNESKFVNAVDVVGLCVPKKGVLGGLKDELEIYTDSFDELLEKVDTVYIHAHPSQHYEYCKRALEAGRHVMCESPLALTTAQCEELIELAKGKNLVLMEALRTAYITAYSRLLLLLKGGKIAGASDFRYKGLFGELFLNPLRERGL